MVYELIIAGGFVAATWFFREVVSDVYDAVKPRVLELARRMWVKLTTVAAQYRDRVSDWYADSEESDGELTAEELAEAVHMESLHREGDDISDFAERMDSIFGDFAREPAFGAVDLDTDNEPTMPQARVYDGDK